MARVLALSGGGFRATLFHLGVVRYLIENRLLSKEDTICSVSGGSVLAAHLALNWKNYTKRDTEGQLCGFSDTAKELIDFVKKDVRGAVFKKWICFRCFLILIVPPIVYWWGKALPQLFVVMFGLALLSFVVGVFVAIWIRKWSRVELLQAAYARLYKSNKLRDLHTEGKSRPKLFILSTDLCTGELCGFSHDGFYRFSKGELKHFKEVNVPVSLAVAASSSFPPAFPPVRLSREMVTVHALNTLLFLDQPAVGSNDGAALPWRRAWQQAVTNSKRLRPCCRQVATTVRMLAT